VTAGHASGAWDAWHAELRERPDIKMLVIQRDNIGDLVLTTPLLRALRCNLKNARIDLLSNSYNAPVLVGNSAIDHHYTYTKLKHRAAGQSRIGVALNTWRLYRLLRRERYDVAVITAAILSEQTLKLARACRPRRIAAFTNPADAALRGIDLAIDPENLPRHAVRLQRFMLEQLLPPERRSALPVELPPCEVSVDAVLRAAIAANLKFRSGRPVVAFHISARKIDQRWSAENFAALMRGVKQQHDADLLLLWAPGSSDNPLHPGDDAKAEEVLALLFDVPVLAHATHTLAELVAVLSLADLVVLSDGGAMHIAAALQKPLVCMFGNSDPEVWQAWQTRQIVLRDASHTVAALSVDSVMHAVSALLRPERSGGDASTNPSAGVDVTAPRAAS
jgi:ADP-heptose:LPS heptosyltransferase